MIHRNHQELWVAHDIVQTHSVTHKCNESQPVGIKGAALTECTILFIWNSHCMYCFYGVFYGIGQSLVFCPNYSLFVLLVFE